MKKDTKKSLVGFGLTIVGVITALAIWSAADGEKQVEKAKEQVKAA